MYLSIVGVNGDVASKIAVIGTERRPSCLHFLCCDENLRSEILFCSDNKISNTSGLGLKLSWLRQKQTLPVWPKAVCQLRVVRSSLLKRLKDGPSWFDESTIDCYKEVFHFFQQEGENQQH